MHILCLYQHYCNPDCAAGARAYTMLSYLAQRHRVTLVASKAWYEMRLSDAFDWVPPGVTVRMVDVPYTNAMSARRRLWAYLHFGAMAYLQGLRVASPDLVYGISTPLTTGWAAHAVARHHRVPWVFEIRDLWPDFPIDMGAVPWLWMQRRLAALERHLYHSASHVVAVSPDMTDHVLAKGLQPSRVSTLLQGTDFDLLDASTDKDVATMRQHHLLQEKQVILYAGSFGRANDLPTLIEAARRLQSRTDLVFVFIGHGYQRLFLEEAAQALPNVRILPPQPRHQTFAWFKLAALSIVSFIDRPVLATNAPTKFFDSLAAGTPVVVTNPGWTKDLVEKHRCGWYVPPSSPALLATCIDTTTAHPDNLRQAGQQGAMLAREQFDRVQVAAHLEQIFLAAVSPISVR